MPSANWAVIFLVSRAVIGFSIFKMAGFGTKPSLLGFTSTCFTGRCEPRFFSSEEVMNK